MKIKNQLDNHAERTSKALAMCCKFLCLKNYFMAGIEWSAACHHANNVMDYTVRTRISELLYAIRMVLPEGQQLP